jgi:hypothetical protein
MKMTQNLVSLNLTVAQLAAVDAALLELETQLTELVSLPAGTKKRYQTLGNKSEAFCRQTLRVLGDNPQLLPSTMNPADAQRDIRARDQLRQGSVRLSRLKSRLDDTEFALGSDVMQMATQGYALLKLVGQAQGSNEVRRGLSSRLVKRRGTATETKAA